MKGTVVDLADAGTLDLGPPDALGGRGTGLAVRRGSVAVSVELVVALGLHP